MNNTFSLERIAKTGDLKVDLIKKQYRLEKMAKLIVINSTNPIIKQSEIAKELKKSSSLQPRYRREMNMLSPYRIPPSSKTLTRKQKTSNHTEHDLKMTSNDLKRTSKGVHENDKPVFKKVKTENTLKGGNSSASRKVGRYLMEQAFLI